MGNTHTGPVPLLLASLSLFGFLRIFSFLPKRFPYPYSPLLLCPICLASFLHLLFSCEIQRCALGHVGRPLVVGRPCTARGGAGTSFPFGTSCFSLPFLSARAIQRPTLSHCPALHSGFISSSPLCELPGFMSLIPYG